MQGENGGKADESEISRTVTCDGHRHPHSSRMLVVMAGSKGKEQFRRPLRQLKLHQKRLSSAEPFPPRALLTNHGFDTDP